MSAKEKQITQIFERTKRIIDQARQQRHLWEHHLAPKLILSGIVPPPWLSNSALHSLTSDPNESNKDDLVSEVLFSQAQSRIPFSGHQCSLISNLVVASDDAQYPICLHNEVHALKKDCNAGDWLSNLPDCSVNNDGCASTGPPELDSSAITPQNLIESRVSDSYHNPALSLAKLQRSKSRQRALEQRNSAKAPKSGSGDDNNTSACAGTITGSVSSSLQADRIEESDLVKAFHTNTQSSSMEEVRRGDGVSQKYENFNYSGCIIRSKSLSQKRNSLNVSSSSLAKEDGSQSNKMNETLEIVINQPCFTSRSCGDEEENKGDYQRKETERSLYHKRLTKYRSSSQATYNSELLKVGSILGRGKGAEVHDCMEPFAYVESTDLSKASDFINGGDFCNNNQGSSSPGRIRLLTGSCTRPSNDFLTSDGSLKPVEQSVPSPQPLVSQHSQDPAVSAVGSFYSQKDPNIRAVKTKENLSSSSSKGYITRDSRTQNHIEGIFKSVSSNFCEPSAACSKSSGRKSQNVRLTELQDRGLSASQKNSILDTGLVMNSAEMENVVAVTASRNTRAETVHATEGSSRPVSSSNLDGRDSKSRHSAYSKSLHEKSLSIETDMAEKVLHTQENRLSGGNPNDNTEDRCASAVAKVDAHYDGADEKLPSCVGSRLTKVSPKGGLDVSVLSLPSDFVMSVMPKQLDFDDVEESSMNGISSPDLQEGQQGMLPEEPMNLLEPVSLLDKETSDVRQGGCNSLRDMHLVERQEVLIREEAPRMEYCTSHFEEAGVARNSLNAMSPNKELPVVQKEICIFTSSLTNSNSSHVARDNSSGVLSKDVTASKFISEDSKLGNDEISTMLADALSAAVTGNGMHKHPDEAVANLTVGLPSVALMDELNVGLTPQVPSSEISLSQNGKLLRQNWVAVGKNTDFSSDFQNLKSSVESFIYDVKHSCPELKRRKVEIETNKFQPAASNLLEKPLDSIDRRSISSEEGNREAVQQLTLHQKEDKGHPFVSCSLMGEMQGTGEYHTMQWSSHKLRKGEKTFILDGRDRSAEPVFLVEANPSSVGADSTRRCTIDEQGNSWHYQVSCGQGSAGHQTCVERSTSSRRIYPDVNAKVSDGSSVSLGIQCLDLISTDDNLPEFEGFILQPDNAQPCTSGDQMELESMSFPSNSIDYTSLHKSRFMHSPLCYSSTPYKLHKIQEHYQSLPNGLLESVGLSTSLPLNDGSVQSLSDCPSNCNGQNTPSFQTLWDRINSNFGSSGKRESIKPELPCISEENENVDEMADTFQTGIGSEGMTNSVTREPLAEIIENDNPTSVLQDDILTDGHVDSVSTRCSFSRTHNKVKRKLSKQDGNRRRCVSKGKKNQGISLGANGAKRTTESIRNRPSRPKVSGKNSMRTQGPTYSEGKSTCNNIVSNITSFVPLVQQKQAAAVITGKRDVKVKALEAAEAAKRMAEKKENERKMKKEALKLERERLEQQNQRQLELQKKMKEEEQRKKEAEMFAKKRQREEEKKEKERKRKRVNDTKKLQEQEKICAEKEEQPKKCQATGEGVQETKKFMDERENLKNFKDNGEGNVCKISEAEPLTLGDPTSDKTEESCPGQSEAVNDCADNRKEIGKLIEGTKEYDLFMENSLQEPSYEISPYKESDDEDEDDDDVVPNNKFIPSWASKHCLSLVVASQKMNPETIFPPQSFCNIAEVLLPRKLQLK